MQELNIKLFQETKYNSFLETPFRKISLTFGYIDRLFLLNHPENPEDIMSYVSGRLFGGAPTYTSHDDILFGGSPTYTSYDNTLYIIMNPLLNLWKI